MVGTSFIINKRNVRTVDPIRRGLRRPRNRLIFGQSRFVRTVDPIRRGLRRKASIYSVVLFFYVRTVDPIRRGLRQSLKGRGVLFSLR